MTTSATATRIRRLAPREGFTRLRRRSAIWSWAIASMGISSATSFGLSLLAGRTLGASGLGVVFAGFIGYVLLLALHRALVTTPLISSSAALPPDGRAVATRNAFSITLLTGALATALAVAVGLLASGPIGDGLLVFAPWLLSAFAYDLFRASLFRDDRGRRAAAIDLAWLGTLVALVIPAMRVDSVWAVAAAWGLGSVVAAVFAAVSMRAKPLSRSASWSWFMQSALPLGRWLALKEGMFAVGWYASVLILTAILGIADVGGLRAADTTFAPFTLLAPALVLAGLPAASRALTASWEHALRLAFRVSGFCVVLTAAYSAVMVLAGGSILTALFGDEFEPYGELAVPMAAWQVAMAAGTGFTILLWAQQRGRAVFFIQAAGVGVTLLGVSVLASAGGVEGAVWGYFAGAVVGGVLLIWVVLRGGGHAAGSIPTPPPVAAESEAR